MTRYLSLVEVQALNIAVMERLGATPAPLCDQGGLESAIMRPQMIAFYEGADLVRQAVVLAMGISQAQAFVDGNKRTAYASLDVFLRLNGLVYSDDPIALAQQLERVAERRDEREQAVADFEAWLRERLTSA